MSNKKLEVLLIVEIEGGVEEWGGKERKKMEGRGERKRESLDLSRARIEFE